MKTKTKIIARYAETDQMGVVHHSVYAVWFEAGRTDFLKILGNSNTLIESKGVILPLYEMSCKFISPVKYEDEVFVITELKKVTRARIIFMYQIVDILTNQICTTGETMHAWTNKCFC